MRTKGLKHKGVRSKSSRYPGEGSAMLPGEDDLGAHVEEE